MQCIARCKSNPFKQCSFKCTHNKLCNKHNNEQNVSTMENKLFTDNEVSNFIKTYIDMFNKKNKNCDTILRKNILLAKYILQYYNYNFNINLKAKDVIVFFKEFINSNNNNILNINSIVKLQSLFRKNYISYINKLKGPGLFTSCVNETDFYTFEEKNKINYNYLFSFQDEKDSIYFFDIRSFKLLLDNNNSNSNSNVINPYNRAIISNIVIDNFHKIIKHLENNNISIDFEPEILSDEQIFNQKIIKIFQKIDAFGYNTSIEWFTYLSSIQLRKLWINLEDIWNYRCNLSFNQKYNIIQKDKPQPFSKFKLLQTKYFFNQNKMLDKKKLQETILDDINIFLTSGINADFCNTGCLYVLTAISSVSCDCLQAMPWLNQM